VVDGVRQAGQREVVANEGTERRACSKFDSDDTAQTDTKTRDAR
jgi:hypothetical protein